MRCRVARRRTQKKKKRRQVICRTVFTPQGANYQKKIRAKKKTLFFFHLLQYTISALDSFSRSFLSSLTREHRERKTKKKHALFICLFWSLTDFGDTFLFYFYLRWKGKLLVLQGDFLCFFFFYFGCCQFHGSQAFANDLLDLNINISIYIYISLFFLIALSASSYLYIYSFLFFFFPP